MVKVIGALMIVGGCGYCGLRIAAVYERRAETLRIMQNALTLLETEISYTATPLAQALERVAGKLNGDCRLLFLKAAELIGAGDGRPASEAWEAGLETLNKLVPFSAEEKSILLLFGRGLGNSLKEEQLKNIALAKVQLRGVERSAVEAREKNKKMWQYMGFCMGMVVVLLLL